MSDDPEASRGRDAETNASPGANPGAARRQKFVLKWVIFACLLANLLVLLWAFAGKRR